MPRLFKRKKHSPLRSTAARPPRVSPHTHFSRRLALLTAFFVVVSLVYAGILIALQARGNAYAIYVESPEVPEGGSTQTVTVQAMRGEIYDRNGKPLVTNRYTYDLTLDHATFISVGSVHARNTLLLSLLDQLSDPTSGTLAQESFPLVGTYPKYTYVEAAADATSSTKADLDRTLELIGLPINASADSLAAYYVETYGLDARIDGIPVYTAEQIDALLPVLYDMDARVFSAVTPYTLACDVSSALISSQLERDTPGVRFTVRAERICHYPGYATHLLGRVGQIFAEEWAYYNAMGYPMNAIVGVSGCESAFESLLHGTDGEMRVTLDAAGRVISREMITQPIAGQDIRLTIDIDAQIAAEDALRMGATEGAVVAMDTATGEYLVLASAPSYDLANFSAQYDHLSSDPTRPLVNRALSTAYPLGKMAHLLTSVAGLSNSIVNSSSLWVDEGHLTVGATTLHCSQLLQTGASHGALNLSTALREGCDVFFGQLGMAIGDLGFAQWESALGIGLATGIELGESAGQTAGIYPGSDEQIAAAAVGASAARATPAQLCSLLSTILESGTRRAGHVLLDVRDFTSGEVIYRKSSETLSTTPIDAVSLSLIKHALRNNVLNDTLLNQATLDLRNNNISVGLLSCMLDTTTTTSAALAFGSPISSTLSSAPTVAVSVVLQGASAETAAAVGIRLLQEYYQ